MLSLRLQAEDAKDAVQDTFSESTGDKAERKTKGEPHVRLSTCGWSCAHMIASLVHPAQKWILGTASHQLTVFQRVAGAADDAADAVKGGADDAKNAAKVIVKQFVVASALTLLLCRSRMHPKHSSSTGHTALLRSFLLCTVTDTMAHSTAAGCQERGQEEPVEVWRDHWCCSCSHCNFCSI